MEKLMRTANKWAGRTAFALIWTETGAGIYDVLQRSNLAFVCAGTIAIGTITRGLTWRTEARWQRRS